MGGAEKVLRIAAETAARSGRFATVRVFVLAGEPSDATRALDATDGIEVEHGLAASEIAGLPRLVRALARKRYAFVMSTHAHLNAAASAARRAGILRTDRLVTRESTMVFERDFGWTSPLIRSLVRLYGAQDAIVCQTTRMAETLGVHTGGRLADRTVRIPNPIELRPEPVRAHPGVAPRIAWCGRICAQKAPERALAVLAALRRDGLDATMVMMGDGELRGSMEALAATLDIVEHVEFTGRISRPVERMRECDIGLMTSNLEGFPNVLLEMLAAGIPRVVTTDCAGDLDLVPGTTVVSSRDVDHLAQAVRTALDEPLAGPEHEAAIAACLAERSPEAFLESLLAA